MSPSSPQSPLSHWPTILVDKPCRSLPAFFLAPVDLAGFLRKFAAPTTAHHDRHVPARALCEKGQVQLTAQQLT